MGRRPRLFYLPQKQRIWLSLLLGSFLLMLINSLLLILFDTSTALLYMSNVLFHVVLGLLLILPLLVFLWAHLRTMPLRWNRWATVAGIWTIFSLATLLLGGIVLFFKGSTVANGTWLIVHIVALPAVVGGFLWHVSMKRGVRYRFLALGRAWYRHPLTLSVLGGLVVVSLFFVLPGLRVSKSLYRTGEGPSLDASEALLVHKDFLPEKALSGSASCGQEGCHPDIYAQWKASAHRMASFNNPYYRKSVAYLMERRDTVAARWCASCHDPVVLFSGRFGQQMPLDTTHWTAHEGITCLSCHAITGLRDLRGNGRYVLEAPDTYPFAGSTSPVGQWLHRQLIRAKPEPHRRAMLKPVHRTEVFCGSCHKVGIPPAVNAYRWLRGQDEYDAWQMSGISGQTVRSFYLPAVPKGCMNCHMPLVPSEDEGQQGGRVRSHRFLAANTALPFLKGHDEQLRLTRQFLQDSVITLDIFHVRVNGQEYGPEEAMPLLKEGDRVEVTVVVRNRKVGHAFPGGTNDAHEVWLRLVARSPDGDTLLASGLIDEAGRVDSTAHFFGGVWVDRASQPINRRNVHDIRAPVWVRTIPPGSAHTVHYRFTVPSGASVASLEASLHYRKFRWYLHNWTFRGRLLPGQSDTLVAPGADRRKWVFDDTVAPALPVVRMAHVVRMAGQPLQAQAPLWERWNDYGIGLFLEGHTRQALATFETVAWLAPESPEGPLNEARVYLAEGQIDRAEALLQEAERRRPGYLKTAYFRGHVYRARGMYDEALREWMKVYREYPTDRVLLLEIGRLHYLSGRYEEALVWIDRVLEIGPEDLGGLYNRMLVLGALGREKELAEARARYAYHKEDEDAQAWTTPYKQKHPSDNLEAQPRHEHELVFVTKR